MRLSASELRPLAIGIAVCLIATAAAGADQGTASSSKDEVVLVGPDGAKGWKEIPRGWESVGAAYMSAGNLKTLASTPGSGVIFNGRSGRAPNLLSEQSFGDVDVHLEFLVPRGSNSGIKLEGVYEVQIFDSYGVAKPTASHNGGVYPRAELLPRYHHIDDGYPPLANGSLPPGQWQTLDIVFHAPRFDAAGKKVANARFDRVVLNGKLVQENLELPCPTGHAWRLKELPTGPILLQGDHGPVAFRNVRVRPIVGN